MESASDAGSEEGGAIFGQELSPALEGVAINGQLAVVYSPLDLGCGWELKPHPYGVGYESRDAIKLGVNVVMYAVSH